MVLVLVVHLRKMCSLGRSISGVQHTNTFPCRQVCAGATRLLESLAGAVSPTLARTAPGLAAIATAVFMGQHLAPPDLADCGAELLQLLREVRAVGKEGGSSAGSAGCGDGAPGGGRGGAGGSSGTLPVAIQAPEPPQGAGAASAPGAGEGRASGAALPPSVLEAGGAHAVASERPVNAALAAGVAPGSNSAAGPAEGAQLHQAGSVTLPPMPAECNPFDRLRRWTSDDDMPAVPHDANLLERFSSMRMASSAALPGRSVLRSPLLFTSEDEGALAGPSSGAPSPQDSVYSDPSAGGMRRATSVTLPPMPPVWNPFGGTRRWAEEGAGSAWGLAQGPEGAPVALQPRAVLGGTAPGGAAPGAAGDVGAAPAGGAQADGAIVAAAATPPLPLPPPALPFVAHAHEPFVAAPGEGDPALPPMWPASKPRTPPPPALPFATRLTWGFDSQGSSEAPARAEANGSAAVYGNGSLARMPAAVLPPAAANGEAGQDGGALGPSAAGLLPSSLPPHAPPAAFPFAARARRGFNRRDSTDSTSGELVRVLPPLLPSKPCPAAPAALPFAARAGEGFQANGPEGEEDMVRRIQTPAQAPEAPSEPSDEGLPERAPAQAPEAPSEPLDEVHTEQVPSEEPAKLPTAAARPGCLLSGVKRLRGPSSEFRASFEAPSKGTGPGTPVAGASSSKRAADFGGGQLRMGRAGGFFWGRKGPASMGKEGLQMPACHPLWLTFEDASLEEAFRVWHSTQLSKVLLGESAVPHAWTPCVGVVADCARAGRASSMSCITTALQHCRCG